MISSLFNAPITLRLAVDGVDDEQIISDASASQNFMRLYLAKGDSK
jgi:hypothetical protein